QLRQTFNHASLHNCYGATETCSPTTIMPMNHPESKMMSVGLPVLGAEVKVINERGEECPPNYPGELLIKGAMVIEGYWDNEEANKKSFEDAFWKSGDVAAVDEDGFVYIMDRKKDMINRGGEKIFSIEIENVLHLHPKILEAAVVGVADKLFGEVVKAFIVPLKGEMILEKEVKQFVAERLADYKVPAEVEFLKELKKNPNGKILKNLLRTSVKS
ncbi:class I adenylate-forming enzyme family protein, partial [Halalkalibacterium ligniniphilum]